MVPPLVRVHEFYGSNQTEQHGYVGYNDKSNHIIVSFAGTDIRFIANLVDDLDIRRKSVMDQYDCKGCLVHRGGWCSCDAECGVMQSAV